MLMNISLKKRTLLVLLSGLTATFTLAQQQPLPEWQSQYAVAEMSKAYEAWAKRCMVEPYPGQKKEITVIPFKTE